LLRFQVLAADMAWINGLTSMIQPGFNESAENYR